MSPDVRISGLPALPPGVSPGPGDLFAVWIQSEDDTFRVPFEELFPDVLPSEFPALANYFANGQPAFATIEAAVVWMLRNRATDSGQVVIGAAPTVALGASSTSINAGQNATFTVLAVPNSGATIASVVLRIGTTILLHTFPAGTTYPASWQWANVAQGNYSIQATAIDSNGNVGKSSFIAVLVGPATGTPTPTPTLSVAVNMQRGADISGIPSTDTLADYEYQFRPAPTVSASRVADLSATLDTGELPSDYEYQTR